MKGFVAGFCVVAAALFALVTPGFPQQEKGGSGAKPPVVIAAAATSYGEGASSVVCLLDPDCHGFWTPQSQDGGVNEGIYIQFREPSVIGGIDVVMEGVYRDTEQLQPYFDGMTGADASLQEYRRGRAKQEDVLRQQKRQAAKREIDSPGYDGSGDLPFQPDQQGNIDGDQLRAIAYPDDLAKVTHFEIWTRRENYQVKSIFLKLVADNGGRTPKILSIRFYEGQVGEQKKHKKDSSCRSSCEETETFEITGTVKPLQLPVPAKAAVTASSVLAPAIAYGPEHLFDSQTDMAWSTDGRKTDGVGESVRVTFDSKQTIQGLMLWNGYQRSEAHYKANGRVRMLNVNGVAVPVKDVVGMQEIRLLKPLEATTVTLTINAIYQGGSYKDVLLSELRFLTPDGRIVLPQVAAAAAAYPEWAAPLRDAAYASILADTILDDEEYGMPSCPYGSMRIRGNGSFVIYTSNVDNSPSVGKDGNGVIEGNWEQGKEDRALRLFGKKYHVPLTEESGYLTLSKRTVSLPGPRIFQSQMKIMRFNELTEAEQRNALVFLVSRCLGKPAQMKTAKKIHVEFFSGEATSGQEVRSSFLTGTTADEVIALLNERMRRINPIFVKSDVYTDLLLPAGMTANVSAQ